MHDWKYEAGKWAKTEPPFPWNDGEDLKVALKRAGYYDFPSETWGEVESGVDLYCRQDGEPPWYISFSIADFCFSVLIYDEQSLLEWIAKYSPAYSLALIAHDVHEALDILGKAFRTWHGHSSDGACQLCDPDVYRCQQEAKQKRKERMMKESR
ncbi:MAG: hypothetical protein U1B77_04545 [Dehalococcoidales bacterium]|nr:hypothetical protein [Dehalococcoidales bacterium]